jgi:hypothetical protein
MNFEKFIHKKVQVIKETHTFYYWYLINKKDRNGVHFHGAKYNDLEEYFKSPFNNGNQYRFDTHGLEIHSCVPIYPNQKPLKNCEVTGGDCYCDGTSLTASEWLGDVNPDNSDDRIWADLYYFYASHFEEEK